MEDELKELAERIRALRDACDYTPEYVASELGIDTETYNEYEKSAANVPISVIYSMAKLYHVDFSEIMTGTSAKLRTYQVVRKGEGQNADRYPGYKFENLAYRFTNKIMQPFLVTLDPSDKPADLVSHKGEEFNLVISGSVVVVFDDQEIILNTGDSIYFNPNYKHGQKCYGDKPATFLTMIAE
jgi:quercetin dioxygenase-like cupin family protein